MVGARAAQASPAASAAVRTSRTDLPVPPPTVCELFAVCALLPGLPGASWPEMVNLFLRETSGHDVNIGIGAASYMSVMGRQARGAARRKEGDRK